VTEPTVSASPPDFFTRASDAELHLWARRASEMTTTLTDTAMITEVLAFLQCCYLELGERYVQALGKRGL
jgi:hypothetical protein